MKESKNLHFRGRPFWKKTLWLPPGVDSSGHPFLQHQLNGSYVKYYVSPRTESYAVQVAANSNNYIDRAEKNIGLRQLHGRVL